MSDQEEKRGEVRLMVSLPESEMRSLDDMRGDRSRSAYLQELIEAHFNAAEAMDALDVEEDIRKAGGGGA